MKATREAIKNEIDCVQEEYLDALLTIVKAFEQPVMPGGKRAETQLDPDQWRSFVAEAFGSTADSPIERGDHGSFERRDPLR